MKLFIFIIFSVILTLVNLQNSCKTPGNEDGRCILITNCPVLFSIIQQKPLNQSALQLVENSNCGYENTIPKVCCPEEQKNTSNNNAAKVVSNFKNYSPCGVIVEDRIVGGEVADLNEFPWIALIIYKDKETNETLYNCAGSLINQRYVMTVVHCVLLQNADNLEVTGVRLGEHNLETEVDCIDVPFTKYCAPPALDIGIEEIIVHEKYSRIFRRNNIALVKLARDVPFSDFIQPACLPNSNTINSINKNMAYVAGWGRTEEGISSKIKLKTEISIVSVKDCNEIFLNKIRAPISENEVCAGGDKKKGVCQGDSGGPLMVIDFDETGEPHWYVVGMAAFGVGCGFQNIPNIFSSPAGYLEWIASKISL